MRVLSITISSVLALCFAVLTGCTAPQSQSASVATAGASSTQPVGDISNPEAEKPPFVGMTKAEALARYGEPKKHTITAKGEQWIYILNYGEVLGKAFIPFNFKPTMVRTGTLIFGPDGKVKEFNWDTPIEG